ncbi:MAG: carboxypeptidase regulatory-like domain-containing protein [Acidimicrobiia bacterium]|nr:carboxypeptidase regulatory-like domain-containing protein [Acidimicrobiia bacterium]
MRNRLTGLVAAMVLATAAGHASPQVSVSTSQQGVPQIMGDLPGLQGPNTKPMEAGGGLIVGRVVDGVEGSGVSGAIVTLTLAGFTPLRVQADSDGRFAFRALPKGSFNISTSRPGYVDGAAGRTRPGGPGRGVTLTDDQRMGDVEIPMWRFAAITGLAPQK